MGRHDLPRRTVLRGLLGGMAATVGPPTLECMLGTHGEALANGAPLPTRFGVWFWGNGVKPDRWTPLTDGAGWTPSEELAPLAELVPWVSVVSGCEIKTATHPHHSGMTGILTGAHYQQVGTTRDTIVSTFARQSVDQDAADHMAGLAPFRSLELGVTHFRGTDEGTTFQHLSHNGPNNPNPSEYRAASLFQRLFSLDRDPALDAVRRSVLDVVADQAHDLHKRLGVRDQHRLDQHLESIRALELRLERDAGVCDPGTPPVDLPDVDGLEPIAEKNALMSDLLSLALVCDLSRVFSVQWSTCGSGVIAWPAGAADSLHLLCHTEPQPQPIVHGATVFTMENLAVFLRRLRDTPEGAGNLLEHSSILCTSELSDGWTHSNTEFPILVAGRGGGRLRGGVHHRSTTRENTSKAVLTALHGAGVTLPGWGVAAGYTDQVFDQLLAP